MNTMKKVALFTVLFVSPIISMAGSKWDGHNEIDEMTDERGGRLYTTSNQGNSAYGDKYALVVRCNSKNMYTPDIFINWGDYIGGKGRSIQLRFDKDPAFSVDVNLSTNGTATFIHDYNVNKILDLMKGKRSLKVRATDFHGTPLTVGKFSLMGFQKEWKKRCGWWKKP